MSKLADEIEDARRTASRNSLAFLLLDKVDEIVEALRAAEQPSRDAALEEVPAAWIEHHKGGDNLNWESVDHPYAKATPLYRALKAQPTEPAATQVSETERTEGGIADADRAIPSNFCEQREEQTVHSLNGRVASQRNESQSALSVDSVKTDPLPTPAPAAAQPKNDGIDSSCGVEASKETELAYDLARMKVATGIVAAAVTSETSKPELPEGFRQDEKGNIVRITNEYVGQLERELATLKAKLAEAERDAKRYPTQGILGVLRASSACTQEIKIDSARKE